MNSLLEVFTTPHRPADFAAVLRPRRVVRATAPAAPLGPAAPAAPAAPIVADADPVARFARSDAWAVVDDDRPLLEVAEAAGLEPRFGCRRGICHRCTTPLLDGTVRDLRDGRTAVAGEHVRLCVTTPVTDVVVDL